MYRWWAAAVILSGLVSAALGATPAAGSSRLTVKITPNRGLVNGQSVTISGRGLARSAGGKPLTWFATECTARVQGRMNPATDTPHCDVTDARALQVRRNGTFSAHFHVASGIIGDGYCGMPGHLTCVIAVGTVQGQGTVEKIIFRAPPATTTTSTAATTTTTR